ncbi:MAG: hypothetical protein JJU20_07335, partial [Opitutales bacterium]|nr:hypothetical protein [Opitutales bacterium]
TAFTPLSHWLGNPLENKASPKPKTDAKQVKKDSSQDNSDCRSTIEVERVGQTISRIHITCSCGDRHSIELHQLPGEDAEVSSPGSGTNAER